MTGWQLRRSDRLALGQVGQLRPLASLEVVGVGMPRLGWEPAHEVNKYYPF